MDEKVIRIDCFDRCRYDLVFPAFFIEASISTSKKLFKWLFMYSWKGKNKETIAFLDDALKELIPDTEALWRLRSKEFQEGYLDANTRFFPSSWNVVQKEHERDRRKRENARLKNVVAKAKRDHETAKKLLESYTELREKLYA